MKLQIDATHLSLAVVEEGKRITELHADAYWNTVPRRVLNERQFYRQFRILASRLAIIHRIPPLDLGGAVFATLRFDLEPGDAT